LSPMAGPYHTSSPPEVAGDLADKTRGLASLLAPVRHRTKREQAR
jgi:hypothetical protein